MSPDIITRLHRELVQALAESRDDPFDRPVTVAEIYQDLVPYRRVRSALGVELNADFEHALLRLLSGEGERVLLEPVQAREELGRELDSGNPNVTLYRKFAACDVWVHPVQDGPEPWADSPRTEPDVASLPEDGPAMEPEAASQPAEDLAVVPPAAASSVEAGAPDGTEETDGWTDRAERRCAFCEATLPGDRQVMYCPFCGADQRRQPCPACGEVLEPEWHFCIRCGEPLDVAPNDIA